MVNIKAYITTKEKVYLTICFILSGLIWLTALSLPGFAYYKFAPVELYSIPLLAIVLLLIIHWLAREFFKAHIFGNSIRVTEMQFSEVYKIALEMAKKMGVDAGSRIFLSSIWKAESMPSPCVSSATPM